MLLRSQDASSVLNTTEGHAIAIAFMMLNGSIAAVLVQVVM